MLTKMYEKQETMEKDMEYLKKEVVAVRDLTESTQKDSKSMCGRLVACESRIKELTKQLQPENLWQTIENKYEHKLKEELDSALQTVVTRQENKIKQEMDNVLETKLETVNKDITSATETLTKVKQNAE